MPAKSLRTARFALWQASLQSKGFLELSDTHRRVGSGFGGGPRPKKGTVLVRVLHLPGQWGGFLLLAQWRSEKDAPASYLGHS